MEMIDRYLQAVAFWLPKQQKNDIIAELSEDIHAQVEEREATLGRPLDESDVEGILKQRGRPFLVASRFSPQESLIGPALYPMYLFCLKAAFLFYIIPWAFISLIILILRPSFTASQSIPTWFNILAQVSGHLWTMSFVAAGTLTLIFAILERVQAKSNWFANWNPRKLPPVRNPNLRIRTNSAFEFAILVLMVAWWAAYMDRTVFFLGESTRIALKPEWLWFFWGYLLLLLITAATAAFNIARPALAWASATTRVLNSIFGSVLFAWLLRLGVLAGIAAPSLTQQQAIDITNGANHWMLFAFPYGVAVGVILTAIEIFKLVRAVRRRSSTA